MRRFWWVGLTVLTLCGMSGCSNSDDENEEENGTPCEADLDCEVGQQCISGTCQAATSTCSVDGDCARGSICEVGACREGCRGDDDCTRAEYCEPSTRTCEVIPEDPCAPGCAQGERCNEEAGQCEPIEPVCQSNVDCAAGEECSESGACVPKSCADDQECGDGAICEAGSCTEGCRNDAACGEQICENNTCTDAECAQDQECGDGQICNDRRCTNACRQDESCGDGQICVNEICVTGCRNDETCGESQICEEDACVTGCRSDIACGDNQICEDDRCVTGCRGDGQCGDGQICADGQCILGCRGDLACEAGQICEENFCVDGCRQDNGCPDGQICNEGACSDGCRDDDRCGDGQICENFECVDGCRGDSNCGDGQICDEGACIAGCRQDNQCGEGFICEENTCAAGCRQDNQCSNGDVCEGGQCIPGCDNDEACEDGEVCTDDRRCRIGCSNDDACGDDEICEDNFCVLGCREDLACGEGRICQNQTCTTGCRTDEGCTGAEICMNNACVTGCREDADCGDGQICEDDVCIAGCRSKSDCEEGYACNNNNTCVEIPECNDDANEDNDDLASATLIVDGADPFQNTICPFDDDVFVFQAVEGCRVTAMIDFRDSNGDLDLAISDSDGNILVDSTSNSNDEEIERYSIQEDGFYYVVVYGYNGAGNDYTMDFDLTNCPVPPPTCPGDDLLEENDTRETATSLGIGESREGLVCGSDEDFFEVEIGGEGCSLDVELLFDNSEGNVDLEVLDANGQVLGSGTSTDNDETVSLSELASGSYFLRLFANSGDGNNLYIVSASVSSCDTNFSGDVVLSEVFYNPDGGDSGKEWVEIYNNTDQAIDLAAYSLAWGGNSWTHAQQQLSGMIQPGQCFLVGGPDNNGVNFDIEVDFNSISQGGIQNSGGTADGVAIFNLTADQIESSSVPVDAVIYGGRNSNNLRDETGSPNEPEIGDVGSDRSIERTGSGWREQSSPTPGNCEALSIVE